MIRTGLKLTTTGVQCASVRVLVTGHDGYIGSVLAPILHDRGHDVAGLDTYLYEGCDLFEAERPAETLRMDVRDVRPRDLEGFDAIVHLAALSNDPLGNLDPSLTSEINFEATVALAEHARAAGVERFVFASSCSMYGTASTDAPVNEEAALMPLTAYAESKVRSEEALARLAGDGFSPVFMRNATVYGASPRLRIDLVLNNLVGWAFTTGRVRVLSDGTPWRPLLHVRDLAAAAAAILAAPRDLVHNAAFNVGRASENYQVRDLAQIVADTVPDCEVEYAGDGNPDPRSYRVDFGKFEQAFPDAGLAWDARRGAEELLAAYREAGLENPRFTRLRRLAELLETGELEPALRWASAVSAP
jgi:nucleoside-diphosphate-sugar epimerase